MTKENCYWRKKPILPTDKIWTTTHRGFVHQSCEEEAVKDGRLVPPPKDEK